jgi:hypothetical protein
LLSDFGHALSDLAPLPLDPRRRDACVERDRSHSGDLRTAVTDLVPRQDHREASLLSPGHAGRPATDRQGPADQGREALAELIADGVARSTDLTPFDPIRLPPLDGCYAGVTVRHGVTSRSVAP